MGIRLGNAFQCQKVLQSKHAEKELPLLYIKQLNPGTSTIKPLSRTTNSRRPFKWKEHINNTCKKNSSTLGFLRRNLQHCPRECRRTAYIALVRSIMEYGSVIWDPYTKQEIKLESIQRSEARFITKDYKSREEGCMTKMLNELNLPTLQSRRQKQRLIFFYKVPLSG